MWVDFYYTALGRAYYTHTRANIHRKKGIIEYRAIDLLCVDSTYVGRAANDDEVLPNWHTKKKPHKGNWYSTVYTSNKTDYTDTGPPLKGPGIMTENNLFRLDCPYIGTGLKLLTTKGKPSESILTSRLD